MRYCANSILMKVFQVTLGLTCKKSWKSSNASLFHRHLKIWICKVTRKLQLSDKCTEGKAKWKHSSETTDSVTECVNVGLLILRVEETLSMRRTLTVLRPGRCLLLLFSSGPSIDGGVAFPPFVRYLCPSCLHDTRRHRCTCVCVCVCVCVWGLCCSICRQSGWARIGLHVVLFMAAFSWVMESLRGFNVGGRHEPRWP